MWFDVGNSPTNDLPRGLSSTLPPRNESVAWQSGTFSGLSAIPAHCLITSSPQASGLFLCQTDNFWSNFRSVLLCAVLVGPHHPTNISGLTKQKLSLDLYNHHSAFISIMERQFLIKFQSGLLTQRDSKASDHKGKSRYLDKALFVYIT